MDKKVIRVTEFGTVAPFPNFLHDVYASIIQRTYRRWRNKEHKYFAMQAIAEYFGHPSRQDFTC